MRSAPVRWTLVVSLLGMTAVSCKQVPQSSQALSNPEAPAIAELAKSFIGRSFNRLDGNQCAAFVRSVLQQACDPRFNPTHSSVLQTVAPWDADLLNDDDELAPLFANSLAGPDIGWKVEKGDLRPGDLVFFYNTLRHPAYPSKTWKLGVITHVGIYVGNGEMVHRDEPVVARESIDKYRDENGVDHIKGGLRIYPHLCPR